ncbi:hypothetical protein [Tropicibacter oceani]|uniref:Uncharacterized protein n=1 Tax=Tropicibacter oceani TaxID=3058420 RepID=A0ABY8QM47_9RHOB|nr:hypothetical protein [Tropicibacter oceani]WGW05013.1 hypothetical protein QF118_05540 [Tropicibacter oceani]
MPVSAAPQKTNAQQMNKAPQQRVFLLRCTCKMAIQPWKMKKDMNHGA